MSYRDSGKKDTYIIDERPIVKREIKFPKLSFPKLNVPGWIPWMVLFVLSPMSCGAVATYTSANYFSGGLMVSIFLFACLCAVQAFSKMP